MSKEKWAKYQPHVFFIGSLLIGGLLLFIAEYWLNGRAKEIVVGVGISFLTAAIIGEIIELAFVMRLAQNIFEVAFGYLLPEEIRKEMKWLYSTQKLITAYRHDFIIEKCDNAPSMVWLHETITRTCKNIGKDELPIKPSLGIEEWFHREGRSEIEAYSLTYGKELKEFSLENKKIIVVRPKKNKQSSYILAIKEDKLGILHPKESYTWVAKTKEMRPNSDDTVSFFGTPSMYPYITVTLPEDMDYDVTFAHPKQGQLRNLGGGHWRLDGLLLPGQAIRIRWWKKNDSERWVSEINEKYPETKFD